jgi:hypothetical protein
MSALYNFGVGFASFTPFGSNAAGQPTPTQFLTLQDISVEFSFTEKPLIGQLSFPVAVARGEGKIAIKVKYARIGLKTLNDSLFAGTVASGETNIAINEAHTAASSVAITPPNSGTYGSDNGVLDAVGDPMILVAATPAVGQYSEAAGTYTFNAGQTGTLLISYSYTVTTGYSVAVPNKPMGQSPQCKLWVANSNWTNNLAILVPAVVFTKLTLPQKNTDWTLVDSEGSAYADSSGNVSYLYADLA